MASKYRYFVKLAYNGTRYLGWQIQRQSPTVQETVNEALSTIFRQDINIVGCGRTDAGVHAREFYAHFDLPELIPPSDKVELIRKFNGYLPRDIVFYDILKVKNNANARFDAISRTYKYEILLRKDPFLENSAYSFFSKLNLGPMNEGAEILFDYTDFTSFSKVNTQVKTNNCKIYEANWVLQDPLLIFTIQADRFLRNMVRAIVGTLLDMGKDKLSPEGFRAVIDSKNRSNAGYSVPAHALYLHHVEYPAETFLQ